jgi:hypothetical protein
MTSIKKSDIGQNDRYKSTEITNLGQNDRPLKKVVEIDFKEPTDKEKSSVLRVGQNDLPSTNNYINNNIKNIYINNICLNELYSYLEEKRMALALQSGRKWEERLLTPLKALKMERVLIKSLNLLKKAGVKIEQGNLIKIIDRKFSLMSAYPPILEDFCKYFNIENLFNTNTILKNLDSLNKNWEEDPWYFACKKYPTPYNRSGDLRGQKAQIERIDLVRKRNAKYITAEPNEAYGIEYLN